MSLGFTEQIYQLAKNLPEVVVDETSLPGQVIFRLNPSNFSCDNDNQLNFLILDAKARPLVLELACDHNLARLLQTKYESVLPSKLMDPRRWVKIIGTGQLAENEIIDLIKLAHRLVTESVQK